MGGTTGGPGLNEDSEYEPKPPRERASTLGFLLQAPS